MPAFRFTLRPVALAVAGLLAACGGGGDGPTTPPAPTVSSVSVSLASASLQPGQTTTATATPRDAQGAAISGKAPTWSTSNASVATVDATGSVSAVATGSADIVATVDGKTGQATLTVTPPPVASVTVTLGSASIGAGQSTQAAAVLRDASGATLTGRTVTWSSSNNAVATVSATGLVSGVSAGAATITATSEGRTGQATVTVIASATIGAVTLLGANGQPLDTSRVAGKVRLSFNETIPTGWRGVREFRIGTRVFRRDSVFGPPAGTFGRVLVTETEVNLSAPIATVTSGQLNYEVIPNGSQSGVSTLIGSIPPAAPTSSSSTVTFTTQQNNYLHLFIKPAKEVTLDGIPVATGNAELQIGAASFDGRLLERIEILKGPHGTLYANNTAGISTVITKTGSDTRRVIAVTPNELSGESPAGGTGFLVKFRWGQTDYDPRSQLFLTAGWAASINGSGFAHPVDNTTGYTLPTNVSLQYSPYPDVSTLLPGFAPATMAWHYDNAVTPPAGAFALLPANQNVGDPLYVTGMEVGVVSNRVRSNYDLRLGVSYTNFADKAGIDPLKTTFKFGQLSLAKTSWQTWSPSVSLSSTGHQYTLGAEACFEDRVGNIGCSDLVTNAANNITAAGSTGAPNQRAAFSVGPSTASITFGGSNPYVNNFATVGSAQRTAQVSGASPALPNRFSAWKVGFSYNGQTRPLFGAGPNGDVPVYYSSPASAGIPGNANFAFSEWTAQAQARYGTDEGIYRGDFTYRLADATLFGSPPTVWMVNDRTPPVGGSLTFTGSAARTNWDAMAGATDNVAIAGVATGWGSKRADARFEGGFRYFWTDRTSIGTGITGTPVTTGSWALGGVIPGSVTFADQSGSFAGTSPDGFDSFRAKFWDEGGNASLELVAMLLGHAPDRMENPPLRFDQYQSVPAVCAGSTAQCGSTPRTGFIDGGITTSTNALFSTSISTFGLHLATKRVHYLGRSTSTSTNPTSGGFNTFYFVPFDAGKYSGPSGQYEIFSVAKRGDDFFVSNSRSFVINRYQF